MRLPPRRCQNGPIAAVARLIRRARRAVLKAESGWNVLTRRHLRRNVVRSASLGHSHVVRKLLRGLRRRASRRRALNDRGLKLHGPKPRARTCRRLKLRVPNDRQQNRRVSRRRVLKRRRRLAWRHREPNLLGPKLHEPKLREPSHRGSALILVREMTVLAVAERAVRRTGNRPALAS